MIRSVLLGVIMLFVPASLFASHAAGGTITYKCLGNGQYKFEIIMFRDMSGIYLPAIMNIRLDPVDGTPEIDLVVQKISETPIPTVQVHPCHNPPEVPNLTYSKVIYESDTVTLPTGTAYDVYNVNGMTPGLCCRNPEIMNISGAGTIAQVLYLRIPDPGAVSCNNAPIFDTLPPVELCAGYPITIDQSATDPDGDSLIYYFCNALDYGSYSPPAIPPFSSVPYATGYSGSYPIQGNPPVVIDSFTGEITGTPTQGGTVVINVCVDEYRNDKMIGHYPREVQVKIVQCTNGYTGGINTNRGDSIISCQKTIDFESNSGADNHLWQFDYPNGADTSHQENPTFTYPDTGTYTVRYIAAPNLPCADTVFVTVVIKDSLSQGFEFLSLPRVIETCMDDSLQLTASGADSYQWLFPNVPCDTCGSQMVPAPVPSHFIVKGVKDGCVNVDTVEVTVHDLPNVQMQPDTNICQGDTIALTASGAVTYQWIPAPLIPPGDTFLVAPASSTSYTVIGTDSNGCKGTDSTIVFVDEFAGVYGQVLQSNGSPLANSTVYLIIYDQGTNTYVIVDSTQTNQEGKYQFETKEHEVYIKAIPDSANYPNQLKTFYDSSLSAANANFVALEACDSIEASFTTIDINSTGISKANGIDFQGKIYPNPAGNYLIIEWNSDKISELHYTIYNVHGSQIRHKVITKNRKRVILEELPNGIYLIQLSASSKSIALPFVIQ